MPIYLASAILVRSKPKRRNSTEQHPAKTAVFWQTIYNYISNFDFVTEPSNFRRSFSQLHVQYCVMDMHTVDIFLQFSPVFWGCSCRYLRKTMMRRTEELSPWKTWRQQLLLQCQWWRCMGVWGTAGRWGGWNLPGCAHMGWAIHRRLSSSLAEWQIHIWIKTKGIFEKLIIQYKLFNETYKFCLKCEIDHCRL